MWEGNGRKNPVSCRLPGSDRRDGGEGLSGAVLQGEERIPEIPLDKSAYFVTLIGKEQ